MSSRRIISTRTELTARQRTILRTALVEAFDKGGQDQPFPVEDEELRQLLGLFACWDRVTVEGRLVSPCPCECNHGGFCGGCGHAGCGRRERRRTTGRR